MVTPGTKPLPRQTQDEQELPESEHAGFRGLVSRANYLAADRVDIICAAKEICRFMSKLMDMALACLERFARYFKGWPRMVFNMPFQQADSIEVYSDADWVGCQRTRNFTSGVCVLIRWHVNKCWSVTQASRRG